MPDKAIKIYINVLLTLAISVAREDPLMAYYHKIRDLILSISESEFKEVRRTLYEELLYHLHSQQTTIYLKK